MSVRLPGRVHHPYFDISYGEGEEVMFTVTGICRERRVSVAKNQNAMAWELRAEDGRPLLNIPWRYAFDQTELGHRPDFFRSSVGDADVEARQSRWEALDLVVFVAPLTTDELILLRAAYPNLYAGSPAYTCRATGHMQNLWRAEMNMATLLRQQEQRAGGRGPIQEVRVVRSPPTVGRNEQPVVEQSAPEEPEVAPDHGERKLLL